MVAHRMMKPVCISALIACILSGCSATQQCQQSGSTPAGPPHAGMTLPVTASSLPLSSLSNSQIDTVQPASHNEGIVKAAAPADYALANGQDSGVPELRQGQEPDGIIEENAIEEVPPSSATNPADAVGQTPQPVEFFVSMALASHPKILAARSRVAAAVNVVPQVRSLPDPMFSNGFWPIQDQALQTAGGRVGHQFGLSQGVPWPEKLHAKEAIACQEVQIAQADVERIEREITEAVRLAYYEVWFASRAILILEDSRNLVNQLLQVAQARYETNGPQQDLLRAQLEFDRLEDQIVGLVKQKEQAQADLATLVQQPVALIPNAQDNIGLDQVPQQLDSLLAMAEHCSPELRGIVAEIRRDRQNQRLACLQKYPDFQLGLNYAIINDDNNVLSPVANGHDNISILVGVTLPIWRERIRAGIQEANARTSSSVQRLDAERDMIYGKLRRLMAQADAMVEREQIYQDRVIPRTQDMLELAFADYRGERADFFTLIETYRELLMFETELARIQATLAGTVAQIERTVGCPYGVRVEN